MSQITSRKGTKGKKAQVSMEYLAIFSITAIMIIPMIFIFSTQSSYLKAEVINAQLDKAGSEIADSAEEVYYMGPPTKKTIKVVFPEGVNEVSFAKKALIFNISTDNLNYDYFRPIVPTLNISISNYEGTHIIVLEAEETYVSVTEIT